MGEGGYLPDTSVVGRAHQAVVAERLRGLARTRRMWTCQLTDLEVVYGARGSDVESVISARSSLPRALIDERVLDRALQVAGLLATSGRHRGANTVDLVVAAAAEAADLTVLHYDADFDRIASVTNQPVEWVAPPGSLDR